MRIQLATCKKMHIYAQGMSFHLFVPSAKFCKRGNRSSAVSNMNVWIVALCER